MLYGTQLKYTIQWFLVYSQNCATIAAINFRTFSSPQKETIYLLDVSPLTIPDIGNH